MPEQQTQSQTLTTVFSDVLQTLAFLFTDDEPLQPSAGDVWLETNIAYRGPVSGGLRLWCTRPFSQTLAANLLGIDQPEDLSDQQSEDAVKEFMNVVCGQYVTSAYGSDAVFCLTIPDVAMLSESPDTQDITSDETVRFSVDGNAVVLIHDKHDCENPAENSRGS